MLLALLSLALIALLLSGPLLAREARKRTALRRPRRAQESAFPYDPGRERRAEQRARELLCSCVNEEEWAMYGDLGFIRVHGRLGTGEEAAYAYLVYPHKPIARLRARQRQAPERVLRGVPGLTGPPGRSRLPASDGRAGQWMALTSDEGRVIRRANMHLLGRQLDPARSGATSGASPSGRSAGRRAPAAREHGRPPLPQPGDPGRSGPRRGTCVPEGHRLRRRRSPAPARGIANTWTRRCRATSPAAAGRAREGRSTRGRGDPMEFNTVAISDGITMGTEGMKASLVSREVVADSTSSWCGATCSTPSWRCRAATRPFRAA